MSSDLLLGSVAREVAGEMRVVPRGGLQLSKSVGGGDEGCHASRW